MGVEHTSTLFHKLIHTRREGTWAWMQKSLFHPKSANGLISSHAHPHTLRSVLSAIIKERQSPQQPKTTGSKHPPHWTLFILRRNWLHKKKKRFIRSTGSCHVKCILSGPLHCIVSSKSLKPWLTELILKFDNQSRSRKHIAMFFMGGD